MAIPAFLTSGASSRAHHALIVALNDARSPQEEQAIAAAEVQRIRNSFALPSSTAKVAERLIILLHCDMVLAGDVGWDWALMPALQLAEGGKTLKERRIGYLFLCERLPRGHELGLLLINTIRKDLTSSNHHDILLALHAIVHLPSSDLLPAVQPLLASRSLLKHASAMIRQKTLKALKTLCFPHETDLSRTVGPRTGFPLSMAKMVKMLSKEKDSGVVSVLLRLVKVVITEAEHVVRNDEERTFLLETVIAQAKRAEIGSQLLRDVLSTLRALVDPQAASHELVVAWVQTVLRYRDSTGGCLLDVCGLVSQLGTEAQQRLAGPLIAQLEALLHPPSSSSKARSVPLPNHHVLALRCLTVLPPRMWDTALGPGGMRTIMEGLHSPDDTTRLATLRLLYKLSPDLLGATLRNDLDNITTSTDLALPLGVPDDMPIDQKAQRGVEETASRALEAIQVQYLAIEEPGAAGRMLAQGVRDVCTAVEQSGRLPAVWEVGLRNVLDMLRSSLTPTREAFAAVILGGPVSAEPTLSVLQATTAVEYGSYDARTGLEAIGRLLHDIGRHSSSIQELLLIASVGIASRLHDRGHATLLGTIDAALGVIREGASGYMQKRCSQIERIMSSDHLLRRIDVESKSRAIPDILTAIIDLARPEAISPTPSDLPTASRTLANSSLRYDAYAPPAARTASRTTSRSLSRSRPVLSPRSPSREAPSAAFVAGEYTLFSADELEANDKSALLDDEERVDNLVGLSLGSTSYAASSRRANQRLPDPFKNDSDESASASSQRG